MTSSATDDLPLVETLTDLERLFSMMGTYGVTVVELGGLKVVRPPDVAKTYVRSEERNPEPRSGPIHDDPFLYPDGSVPSFK